jgi:prepilin-type N-terminal cleavage/methylation domain-containing protein
MNPSPKRQTSHRSVGENGFTLIEVIVTIIFAAILGALLVEFMGTKITSSAALVASVDKEAQLKAVMEDITSDYRDWLRTSPGSPLSQFAAQVNATPAYAAVIVGAQTGMISVDAGHDGDVAILQITISDGTRTLRALFTNVT